MRHSATIGAIVCLAAGMAFAQAPAQPETSSPGNPSATAQPTPNQNATTAPTEAEAKAKFEAEGYSNVTELKKDANGKWTARAMKGGKNSEVSLDNGRVTETN